MIVLLYRAATVGAVCRRVAEKAPDHVRICKDEDYEAQEGDLVVRWDSTATVWGEADMLQTARAVKTSRNKSKSREVLGELAPKTWFEPEDIELPAIVRPRRHHAGKKFFVVRDVRALKKAITSSGDEWYASPILDKEDEYRVYVLQGHAVSVSKRRIEDKSQIAWNVAQGAEMFKIKRATWPLEVVKLALKAAERLNLKWAAVDVAVTKSGEVVVFELNTAPGLVANAKSLVLIAKALVYADTHRNLEPAPEEARTWKSLLHPGLRT